MNRCTTAEGGNPGPATQAGLVVNAFRVTGQNGISFVNAHQTTRGKRREPRHGDEVLEHGCPDHALPNAQNCALKRRPLDGDCNFEHLPILVGVHREQCDGFAMIMTPVVKGSAR
nr:VirK family protein [Bradyrhizobium sp. WSM2254]